ncbi:TolC family protein [Aliifodinibius sp. S!AR15-10]|uniref:TolC family protein n=1 Tax=Aliifodinibius sp. S!AR15-10 TaxID=2950437 RepID=UPI002859C032|nr:TolC family protein [Aliifodinibius sp. S!AR15-10]MDR8392032.1 TolC family protein [Aliifodinibius sp. S!AR15-10]
MKSRKFFTVLLSLTLFLFVGSVSSSAQDANTSFEEIQDQSKPVTLTQAIQVAMANNTDIKRALLTLEDADEQVRIAWSEVLPDVSGSATYTRNVEIPVNFVPAQFFDPSAPAGELVPLQFGTDNNWQGGLTVSQTLFRGEAIVGISSSELYKAAQAENLRATTQQIVTQTRLAYYNVLVAEEQLRLQTETVERLRQNLKENRARQKAGLIDEYAVLQVEVQLKNQEPQLTQARYDVQQAYRELNLVLGLPVELGLDVQGDLSSFDILSQEADSSVNDNLKEVDKMTPYSYEKSKELMNVATELRGDIRILDKQEDLKQREIKAIKSRFLPTLSANYNLNWSAAQAGSPNFFGTEDTRARSQTVALTFSLPIFQGFERNANLQIAKIEQRDLELQREQAVRDAKNEIQSARESLNQAIETAPAREDALEQAREGYQRAQARLESGLGSQLDVIEAEFQLRQAEVNYAQMVYNYLSAKAQYDQAIGMVPFVDESKPELD